MTDIGDFAVSGFALDFAQETQSARDQRERAPDRGKRAPVTTDATRWASMPGELDFPGIDTPTEAPNLLPKDLMQPQKPNLTAKARDEAPVAPVGTEQRERQMFREEAAATEVQLTPEEAFGGAGMETAASTGQRRNKSLFAGGAEADVAFMRSEDRRARDR